MIRRLVLMAKSKKGDDGYCVAGIDLDSGEWMRLNVPRCYSIPRKWFRYKNGKEPELLESFSVDILSRDNSEDLQPENYYCDLRNMRELPEDGTGAILYRISKDAAHDYVFYDNDTNINSRWLYGNIREHHSLMIIEPNDLTFFRDDRGKVLAFFEYKGKKYKGIRVTDLDFIAHWDETGLNSHYRPEKRCLLVVSLGLPFSKDETEPPKCWKLIASVIRITNDDGSVDEEPDDNDEEESQISLLALENSDEDLLEKLKTTRSLLAREEGVPSYCIFHDKSLKSMCDLLPVNDEEFLSIHGVGVSKLEKYGEVFMDIIRDYVEMVDSGDADFEEPEEDEPKVGSYSPIELLRTIIDGFDPGTGEELDVEALMKNEDFCSAVKDLYHKYIQPRSEKPKRAGLSWDEEEDKLLESEFMAGLGIVEIAEVHGRTIGAIVSRLTKQGLIEEP